jgi:hypothetical protein
MGHRRLIILRIGIIHRLDEESGKTDLQSQQGGQPLNKTLLLVQQACMAIDGMLTTLSSYIATDDQSFLGFARENNKLAWSVRKVM